MIYLNEFRRYEVPKTSIVAARASGPHNAALPINTLVGPGLSHAGGNRTYGSSVSVSMVTRVAVIFPLIGAGSAGVLPSGNNSLIANVPE